MALLYGPISHAEKSYAKIVRVEVSGGFSPRVGIPPLADNLNFLDIRNTMMNIRNTFIDIRNTLQTYMFVPPLAYHISSLSKIPQYPRSRCGRRPQTAITLRGICKYVYIYIYIYVYRYMYVCMYVYI